LAKVRPSGSQREAPTLTLDEDVYPVKPRQGLNASGEIHRAAEKRKFLPFAGTHEAREP